MTLRIAALVTLVLGAMLVLGTWDGLWEPLDLPQGFPALTTQLGGVALVALAYVLWAAAARPELAPTAAIAGFIAHAGGAGVIASWLLFRDQIDLEIGDRGTGILIGTAIVLLLVALALARVALGGRRETARV